MNNDFLSELTVVILTYKTNKDILSNCLNSIDKKLGNESFVKNAPKKVIEIELKKKDDTVNKLKSLKEQLNSFNEST